MHKRENLNIQSHIVRAFQKSFFFYILISNPAPLLKATRLVPGRPSEAETYSSTKQLKIRHADSYTCSYHIKCVPMCFHPQQFVRNALSNSFYWQSAWRSCQDGGIVAIQVLNWYIYIPTCNPSPMPKRFSNIKGKTMWPTLLGIWRIPWPHGYKCFLVIALRCANEKLSSSRRLMLSYACVCVHTSAFHVFCSEVLRWPTN